MGQNQNNISAPIFVLQGETNYHPTTIEGIVGSLGLHSLCLVGPHPLGPAELNRDNPVGWPCRIDYHQILDYEVVGNFIKENFPEYLPK